MDIDRSKKLMLVIPSLSGGGAERVAALLLKELNAQGLNIVLVLFSRKNDYGVPDKVKARYIDIEPRKNIIYTAVKFFLILFRLRKIIKEERPFNMLSFMDYTNIMVILSNMLILKKTKMTISVRSSPILYLHKYSMSFWNRIISVLIRLLYNKADRIVSVSDFIKNDLIENFNVNREKIVTICNPVDSDAINLLAEEEVAHPWFRDSVPIILSAGRLSKEKGYDYLFKAFAIVRQNIMARLVIMGEGEVENNLKNLCKSIGIEGDVAFLGFEKNPYKYMKTASVYVLSSLYEGFPNVLIEAMACGLPIISTIYNPGFNEIVEHEKNGLLVPVADEKALAEAMLRLLTNPEERRKYSASAKERIKEFSLEKIAGQYKRVLLDI